VDFEQSDFDPCLFMKKGIVCVVFADDTSFAGPMEKNLKKKLLVSEYNYKSVILYSCRMKEKLVISQVSELKKGPNKFHLTQHGLTEKLI